MSAVDEVGGLLEKYKLATAEFVRGDPEPYKALFSHREDVTLANPFFPVVRGWDEVSVTLERTASRLRDGAPRRVHTRLQYKRKGCRMTLVRKLRDIRKSAGLTQEDLEHQSGVSQQYISQVETGKRELTEGLAQKLAPVIGIEWQILMLSHIAADAEEDFILKSAKGGAEGMPPEDVEQMAFAYERDSFLRTLILMRFCWRLTELGVEGFDRGGDTGVNLLTFHALHEFTKKAHEEIGEALAMATDTWLEKPIDWRLELEAELKKAERKDATCETPSDSSTTSETPGPSVRPFEGLGRRRIKTTEKAS